MNMNRVAYNLQMNIPAINLHPHIPLMLICGHMRFTHNRFVETGSLRIS